MIDFDEFSDSVKDTFYQEEMSDFAIIFNNVLDASAVCLHAAFLSISACSSTTRFFLCSMCNWVSFLENFLI